VRRLKKGVTAVLAGCMLAFVMASAPAVAASDTEPLRAEVAMSFDMSNFNERFPACMSEEPLCVWSGDLSGDVVGSIVVSEFWERIFVVGNTEHFFEAFTITTSHGVISGVDNGVWDFNTNKVRANGWVTEATGDWSYLIGYKLHESGYVIPPPAGAEVLLYDFTGAIFLVAP
jgi:hypothetical protein